MASIAVIFPSRGLAFSQTCEELLDNLEGYEYEIFFAHGIPIPDCFNVPLKSALKKRYTHYWFVEDDMILPKNLLKKLLAAKVPAITCDYPVTRDGKPSVLRDPKGKAIYGGTGCLLVTHSFLKSYKQPIFRTDIAWDVKNGETLEMTPRKIKGNAYGLHDITFGLLAPKPIRIAKMKCGQRKLLALGTPASNDGQHLIESWTTLKPETIEVVEPSRRNVILKDGTEAFMDVTRGRELEKKGLAKVPEFKYVSLVENEVLAELR